MDTPQQQEKVDHQQSQVEREVCPPLPQNVFDLAPVEHSHLQEETRVLAEVDGVPPESTSEAEGQGEGHYSLSQESLPIFLPPEEAGERLANPLDGAGGSVDVGAPEKSEEAVGGLDFPAEEPGFFPGESGQRDEDAAHLPASPLEANPLAEIKEGEAQVEGRPETEEEQEKEIPTKCAADEASLDLPISFVVLQRLSEEEVHRWTQVEDADENEAIVEEEVLWTVPKPVPVHAAKKKKPRTKKKIKKQFRVLPKLRGGSDNFVPIDLDSVKKKYFYVKAKRKPPRRRPPLPPPPPRDPEPEEALDEENPPFVKYLKEDDVEETLINVKSVLDRPPYVDTDVLRLYPDLQIATSDGFRMEVNRAVLSTAFPKVGSVLSTFSDDQDLGGNLLLLDVRKSHLQVALDFSVSGHVPFGLRAEVKESFSYMGVELDKLDWEVEEGPPPAQGLNFMVDVRNIQRPHYYYPRGKEEVENLPEAATNDHQSLSAEDFGDIDLSPPPMEDEEEGESLIDPDVKVPDKAAVVRLQEKVTKKAVKTGRQKRSERPPRSPSPPRPRRPPSPIQIPDEARRSSRKREVTKRMYAEDDVTEQVSEPEGGGDDDSEDEGDEDFDYYEENRPDEDEEEEEMEEGGGKRSRVSKVPLKRRFALVNWMERQKRIAKGEDPDVPEDQFITKKAGLKERREYVKELRKRRKAERGEAKEGEAEGEVEKVEKDPKPAKQPRKGPKPVVFDTEGERDESKKYQCDLCVYSINSKQGFITHMKRHRAEDPMHKFFCVICDRGFANQEELKRHRKEDHPDKLVCPHCAKEYCASWKIHFDDHVRFHEDESINTCAECGAKHKSRNAAKVHREAFGPLHEGRCAYDGCQSGAFSTWSQHQDHVAVAHGGEWRFRCGHCGLSCFSRGDLRMHREREHLPTLNSDKMTPCDVCGKMVRCIKSHMDALHGGGGGSGASTCEHCGKAFPNVAAVRKHIANMHTPSQCSDCGMVLKGEIYLRRHRLKAHTPAREMPYRCQVCGKGFVARKRMLDHSNVHTGAKPYKCRYCGAGFPNDSNRRQHEKAVHLKIKTRNK